MHAHQLLGPPAPAGCQANCALRTLALHAAHCLPTNNNNNKYDACGKCVTRRKQQRPGIASNDNTTHVPTARSSADLTKPNHTPTRHTRAKDKIILQMATTHTASSQRTHVSRTQGRGRTHPVTMREMCIWSCIRLSHVGDSDGFGSDACGYAVAAK